NAACAPPAPCAGDPGPSLSAPRVSPDSREIPANAWGARVASPWAGCPWTACPACQPPEPSPITAIIEEDAACRTRRAVPNGDARGGVPVLDLARLYGTRTDGAHARQFGRSPFRRPALPR